MSDSQGYDVPEGSEQLDQIQQQDSLNDRGVDDVLDEGLTTAENWSAAERGEHETLEQRLSEEEPDVGADGGDDDDYEDYLDDGEVGHRRSGRLIDPNEGIGNDDESELYGEEVGIDGAAASAEEAAVHVVDGDDD